MRDAEVVRFLQWALPEVGLRWPGFRKVRRQVSKRISHRVGELGLAGLSGYRAFLETHPEEWGRFETFCRISISRFYRDREVFRFLEQEVLPALAKAPSLDGELRCWSVGCAGGEEPYTVSLLWQLRVAPQFPARRLRVLATDVDLQALRRAQRACYSASSVKDLPASWLSEAFVSSGDAVTLKPDYRTLVTFLAQDVRHVAPMASFQLILCRNVVFTYFDDVRQRETLATLIERLENRGALVIGKLERLPEDARALEEWSKPLGVYRKP